jgi:hypothetical protein
MEELMFLQTMFHYKAQHLSALNNSFLPLLEDDSQSNLYWNCENASLESRRLENGSFLSFDYLNFQLIYQSEKSSSELSLLCSTEIDTLLWIKNLLLEDELDGEKFQPKYSYKLPQFEAQVEKWGPTLKKTARQLSEYRCLASMGLSSLFEEFNHLTEIRVWRHHFDTRMLVDLDNNFTKGLGLGYAIKDNICNTPYYYCYAWSDGQIKFDNLPKLDHGKWLISKDWKGTVLPIEPELNSDKVNAFYKESAAAFLQIM